MKRTLLFLIILCSFFDTSAQIYQPIPGYGFAWNRIRPDSVLHLPFSNDTTLRTNLLTRPQIRQIGDSTWAFSGSRWFNLNRQIDTSTISTKANVTGLLVGYATTADNALKLNISDTAAMLANRLRISDTATMLLPFVQYSDTAAMLSKYFRTTTQLNDTTFVINRPDATADTIQLSFLVPDTTGKLSIIDTSAMLAPYRRTSTKITNSDLANSAISGISLGSNLNNLTAGNGLSGTAYNGGTAYTWQVDTSTISTKANVTGLLVGYATTGDNALKLNISDTASMLANRLRISDTATMLTPFVQYSDTANQMSGYQRLNFALLLQDTAAMLSNRLRISDTLTMLSNRLKISDTSNMLSPYARTANLPSLAPYLLKADSLSGGYTTWALTKKKIDSIGALKVNYTDTAAIVANRLKISDTATMLLPFVQYSDTASIVAGYVRSLRFTDSLTNVQSRIQSKLAITDTAAMLAGYTRLTRFTDSLTAVQARIQTKQPLGAYITLADSSTILAGRWLPNRSADSIAVIRALANTKGVGTVTSVTASAPLSSSGGTTPNITISQATTSTNGFLTSTDWNTFNDKASTASVALKLNISDTAEMMSKSFRTTTQVNDTTFTINRPDGTKDTIALSVQVPSTSQLVYNTALTTDADYSLGLSDTYVQLVSTSTPRTLTLPAASTCLGRVVILNSKVGGGSGWTSTQTIYTTYPTTGGVTSLNGSVDTIISNGTNWIFLTRY